MPWTPWRRTSSATRNASTIEVLRSSTVSSRLLGTTISVSTSSASAAIPASACSRRREPSNWNGRVTIPTVSAPSSRAIWATTGAAPVPVPPPAPAAMNTMSEPRSSALMRSYSSRAAWRPRSGFEPEPRPRVIASPMCRRLVGGGLLQRLQVGVDRDELDALDLGLDHAVDGVDAGAADADHGQDRADRGTQRVVRAAAWRTRRVPAGARAPRAQSITFSGMSAENAWRSRSWGDGMRRSGSSGGAGGGGGLRLRRPRGCRLRCGGRLRRGGRLLARRLRRRLAARAVRCPRRSYGRGPQAVPRACSRAYRLAFERTSFASCL